MVLSTKIATFGKNTHFILMERKAFNDDFPVAQLGMTVLVAITSLLTFSLLALLLAIPIFGVNSGNLFDITNLSNPKNIPILKYIQIVQSTSLFIIAPIFLAKIFSGNSSNYLHINKRPQISQMVIVAMLIVVLLPVTNLIAELNSMIKFPDFMSSIEAYLQRTEKEAETLTEAFLKTTSINGLCINLLMIGVIPAIGEEFLFRGVLQRIFSNWTKNSHWGIIISALIFSAIHMQFYGFFPRFLLGAMFGYLFLWSGSLWLPILAHFVNNSLAVIAYYLVSINVIDEKIINIGISSSQIPLTLTCIILSALGIYKLYTTRNGILNSNLSEV